MNTLYPTTRNIAQVVRRHMPGSLISLDEHDLIGEVSGIRGEPDFIVDRRRLHYQVLRRLRRWVDAGGTIVGINPDDLQEADIVAIRPVHVEWKPFSSWYHCSNSSCLIWHCNTDADFTGRCRLCDSLLRQARYVLYHFCGSIAELKPSTAAACPNHGLRSIWFEDKGDFLASPWRCRQCSHQKLYFFPYCFNPQCRARAPQRGRYSGSLWRDQWVHYAQTAPYVNFDERKAKRYTDTPRGRELVHLAVLGEISAGHLRLNRALDLDGGECLHCGQRATHGARFCAHCGQPMPIQDGAGPNSELAELPITTDDGRTAWALLRDLEESQSLADIALSTNASAYVTDANARVSRVGVRDLVLVKEFPLTLAAIGYTRERPGTDAWFRAFPKKDEKNVAYTYSFGTEALMIQLKASALIAWMRANALNDRFDLPEAGSDEARSMRWYLQHVTAADSALVPIVEPLLHSYSHIWLQSLAISAGLEPSSLGELILTDALGFALYAGDSELGAVSAAFDQSLNAITDTLSEFSTCKFDPTCATDDNGSCVGCLHLSRGCERFNDQLSRAYLFGGRTGNDMLPQLSEGYFSVLN